MEKRGDVLIQGLWEVQTDAIIDVIFDDADIYTYRYEPMDKILDFWEKEKKDKHSKKYHDHQKLFSMFVFSVDGILGRRLKSYSRI